MKCKVQALICILACSLAVSGCVLRVPPKPVTSSEWILEVCDGFNQFIAGFQGNFEADLLAILSSIENATDVGLADVFKGAAAEGEDLVAVLVAVEPRVPETDIEGYQLFRAHAASIAEVFDSAVENLESLDDRLGDDGLDDDALLRMQGQVSAVFEETALAAAKTEQEFLSFDSSALSPETLRAAEKCWLPKPPNCSDPTQGIICPGDPDPIDPGVPWASPLRPDADASASDLAGIGIFASDIDGSGWVHEFAIDPSRSMMAFGIGTLAAGCATSTVDAPPLPLFDEPVTASLGSLSHPDDLGWLAFTVDQYASVDQAAEMVAAIEAAFDRCNYPRSASPPIVGHTSITPYAQSALFEASPFGEFFPNAPTGEMEYVYLADGPFVGVLMSDPYGVAAPAIDDAKDLLGARLQSAATSWEDQ